VVEKRQYCISETALCKKSSRERFSPIKASGRCGENFVKSAIILALGVNGFNLVLFVLINRK
jgi:hypothetical protein